MATVIAIGYHKGVCYTGKMHALIPDTTRLPRYASHKEVHALKISNVDEGQQPGGTLHFRPHTDHDPVHVSYEWMTAKQPHAGGYLVVYDDGYTSFSPAKAFEEGYQLIKGNGAVLTREQLTAAAVHFKTQRNHLRDAALAFIDSDLKTSPRTRRPLPGTRPARWRWWTLCVRRWTTRAWHRRSRPLAA